MAQFSVPSPRDFIPHGIDLTYTQESDGTRILKGSGLYQWQNRGFMSRGGRFFVLVNIKNSKGIIINSLTTNQILSKSEATASHVWNFSISENKPYKFLKDNSLSVNAQFLSRRWQRISGVIEEKSPMSHIQQSPSATLVNIVEEKRLAAIQIQEITFNEQTNSGDFNETPITDINLSSGCSECTDSIEKELPNNNMKFAGIAITGVIGLLLYTKGVFK